MLKKPHFGVLIGRFQGPHKGHENLIREAADKVDKLFVFIGSANIARSPKDPLTYEERRHMIQSMFPYEVISEKRIIISPLDDHYYSDTAWVTQVQRKVRELALEHCNSGGFASSGIADVKISLAGYKKDESTHYLNMFPEWENIQIPSQYGTFGSTDVRRSLFNKIPRIEESVIHPEVAKQLKDFTYTEDFKRLLEDAEYYEEYPKIWGKGPFVTADAVVIQSGHILLIERGKAPGRGLLALPGGFVEPGERIRDGAIRELRQEASISDSKGEIPPGMLASFIEDKSTEVFDAPNRSLRGRVITHAFLFRFPDRKTMFKVKAGTNPEDPGEVTGANWYRLGDIDPTMMFEDHWSIIEKMADL